MTVAPESEACVVGTLLSRPDEAPKVFSQVPDEAFYTNAYRLLYRAIKEAHQKFGVVELPLVKQCIQDMTAVGGENYLAQLAQSKVKDLAPYVEAVMTSYRRRKTGELGQRLAEMSSNGATDEDIARVVSQIRTAGIVRRPMSTADQVTEAWREMDRLAATGVDLWTGIKKLDDVLGGMMRKYLYTVGASTSHGKTSLMANFAHNNLKKNPSCRILYNGFENTDTWWARLAAIQTQTPLRWYTRPHQATEEEKAKARSARESVNQYLDRMMLMKGASILEMRGACEEFHPDIIILDYVQRYAERYSKEDVRREVSKVVSSLQDLAIEYNASVWCLSQFARQLETANNKEGKSSKSRMRPKLSWLKESGDIECFSDFVMLIDWPWKDTKDASMVLNSEKGGCTPYHLLVEKNKLGPCEDVDAAIYFETLTVCDM